MGQTRRDFGGDVYMPRTTSADLPDVEHLSILSADGELDADLEPDLGRELLVRAHRTMLLGRRADERMLSLQREGKIGTFGPVVGQEAAQAGAASTLRDDDWSVPSYRQTVVGLWRGLPLSGLLLYNAGYNEGGRIPEDGHDMPIAIPVGTQMLHAVGIAYAWRRLGDDQIAMTWHGDGATESRSIPTVACWCPSSRTRTARTSGSCRRSYTSWPIGREPVSSSGARCAARASPRRLAGRGPPAPAAVSRF